MDIAWGTDNELTDSQFFNRTEDINLIYNLLNTTRNASAPTLLLTGVRGVGKTVLMKKIKKELEKDYLVIYVDISKSNAFQEKKFNRIAFMELLYESIIKSCNEQEFFTLDKKIYKLFKTNKISIDKFIEMGDIPLPPFLTEINYPQLADFVINLPQRIYEEYSFLIKGVIVFFDEFQYIKDLDEDLNSFLWYLRSSIQDQKNVAYVLSGSMSLNDELIEQISGKKGAFGGRMLTIEISPFSYETTKNYIEEKADLLNFTEEGLKRFYKCTRGVPSYINNFLKLLPQEIILTEEIVKEEFRKDINFLNTHYINLWSKLTLQEQKIVVSLIDNDLLRKEIADSLGVTSGSISKQLKKLMNLMLIEHENDYYRIYDEIFRLWLKKYKKENDVYPYRII